MFVLVHSFKICVPLLFMFCDNLKTSNLIKTREFLTVWRADKCKNCVKCDKGYKIGTNEAYNIKIKTGVGGISKIFCFCCLHANMAASDKDISLKRKKFLLNFIN